MYKKIKGMKTSQQVKDYLRNHSPYSNPEIQTAEQTLNGILFKHKQWKALDNIQSQVLAAARLAHMYAMLDLPGKQVFIYTGMFAVYMLNCKPNWDTIIAGKRILERHWNAFKKQTNIPISVMKSK